MKIQHSIASIQVSVTRSLMDICVQASRRVVEMKMVAIVMGKTCKVALKREKKITCLVEKEEGKI